ncbi:hypothetical protein B2K_39405 [Paenibacillus mucilaginosus K02]|uniref:Uncharacterized protein n=1 Tax=Paenibacillus mucilaginosus K02 TaxID=997761 RepID=R9UN57_9BACL|nr:hypothetical protein B2K_39405 [Paenibacillus mucilaginosus K02]
MQPLSAVLWGPGEAAFLYTGKRAGGVPMDKIVW